MISSGGPIAPTDGRQNAQFGNREAGARAFNEPPTWLAHSVAEFGLTQQLLDFVRPIRAFAFGGILVFIALFAFLMRQSPVGQSVLFVVAIFGLPLFLAAWFVASRALRRLTRKKNRIQQRVYGAGLRLEDDGRVQTDNPHPVLVLDAESAKDMDGS